MKLNSKARPRAKAEKKQKSDTIESINGLYRSRKVTLNTYKGSATFPLKPTQGKEFKILNLKQILERLEIAFAQVKASNTS